MVGQTTISKTIPAVAWPALEERNRAYAEAAQAPATLHAYPPDWLAHFHQRVRRAKRECVAGPA
jgi:hypothetical protein